jgi:hypothetical protein
MTRPAEPSQTADQLRAQDDGRMCLAVGRGNIVYTQESFQSGHPHVPPFISNGIIGGCFDLHGFMSHPNTGYPQGRTVLGYNGHHHARAHGQHVQFHLAYIRAHFSDAHPINLVDCRGYRQELDLLSATLTTSYDLYGPTRLQAYAPLHAPNLFVYRLERTPSSTGRVLHLEIEAQTAPCQNNDSGSKVDPVALEFHHGSQEGRPDRVAVTSRTNATCNRWIVQCTGAKLEVRGTHVHVRLDRDAAGFSGHTLMLWVERADGAGIAVLDQDHATVHTQHAALWRAFWETSWVSFPEERAQAIWTRTKYYLGCNFPLITARPMCPTGVLSNIWGYYFPQDVYFMAENLPRLGHGDRALVASRDWLRQLPEVRAYGQRLLGVAGAYYPWTPPFQDYARFEIDGVVGADSYELHNPAYVLAIVWHQYLISRDREMLAIFLPIISGVFEFYRNISTKGTTGTWDIHHPRARGQDEASSTAGDLRNLLCAGFSAQYAALTLVQAAQELSLPQSPLLEDARDIALHGMSRQSLLRTDGWYTTYEGDVRANGQQKHPVQLNPIAYLPMPEMTFPGSPCETAWRNRFELTLDAKRPYTCGWTLGEFALASARMRSPAELEKDLYAIQPCRSADPNWIQFYESSFQEGWHLSKSYYFPMSGLYLQAFTDCLVQDWRGHLDVFACLLPQWRSGSVSFHGIRARGDLTVSGSWDAGRIHLAITPGKNSPEKIQVRISQPLERLVVVDAAGAPPQASGNQIFEVHFAQGETIHITSP